MKIVKQLRVAIVWIFAVMGGHSAQADVLYTDVPQMRCVSSIGYFELSLLDIWNVEAYPPETGVPEESLEKKAYSCHLQEAYEVVVNKKSITLMNGKEVIFEADNKFDRFRISTYKYFDIYLISAEACIIPSNLGQRNKGSYRVAGCVYRGGLERKEFSFSYENIKSMLIERIK